MALPTSLEAIEAGLSSISLETATDTDPTQKAQPNSPTEEGRSDTHPSSHPNDNDLLSSSSRTELQQQKYDNMAVTFLPNYFVANLGDVQAKRLEGPNDPFDVVLDPFTTIIDLLHQSGTSEELKDNPAVGFPLPGLDGAWRSEVFSFMELRSCSMAVAVSLRKLLEPVAAPACVALLCCSNIDFLFTWLGLIWAGYPVLLVAPQCQPEAIASLCKDCNAKTILYSEAYRELAMSASEASSPSKAFQNLFGTKLRGLPLPQLTKKKIGTTIKLWPSDMVTPVAKPDSIAYIHHTSGTTTGLPKPIALTHHHAVGVLPRLEPTFKATFTTTPLYHGGIADCFRAWSSGELIWLFPGSMPITERNIALSLEALEATKASQKSMVKYFSCVPYILQMVASDSEGIAWLQKMEIVGIGGAAPPAGLRPLVLQGINLVSRFGSTECGFLLSSYRYFKTDTDWEYLRSAKLSPFLRFEVQDSEVQDSSPAEPLQEAELVVLKGWPLMTKTNRDDGSFATGDLFLPHKTREGLWKFCRRNEGLIALSTGKKFDPALVEGTIVACRESIRAIQQAMVSGDGRSSHFFLAIKEIFVFGAGRHIPGVLVFVNRDAGHITPNDIETIWGAVSRANMSAESHSRISKDMIIVRPYDPSQPLEKSSKGTLNRRAVEKRFSKDILDLYGMQSGSREAKLSVQLVIMEALGKKIDGDQNFFENGVDSQMCSHIRKKLQENFRVKLPWNIVYNCENMDNLTKYFENLNHGRNDLETEKGSATEEMLEMVERFSTEEVSDTRGPQKGQKTVVLTGATGMLGAYILGLLLSNEDVCQIYCLVRANTNSEAQRRVLLNLKNYNINYEPGSVDVIPNLECLASKLDDVTLGLDNATWAQLNREVSLIIHAAWPLHFLLPLSSFESALGGLYHLLVLTQRSTSTESSQDIPQNHPEFIFCSSTASVFSHTSIPIPEEISTLAAHASSSGYARSKWVAERVCSLHEDCPVKVVRLGQLTGETKLGQWNRREAYPLMLSTAKNIRCLPAIKDALDWLPVDLAAKAVVDIAFSPSGEDGKDGVTVYHVLNKHRKPTFLDLLNWAKECAPDSQRNVGLPEIPFDIVDPKFWMDELEKLKEEHPAKPLLGFWRGIYGKKETGRGQGEGTQDAESKRRFATEEAEKVSDVMRNMKPVDEELAKKIWLWVMAKPLLPSAT